MPQDSLHRHQGQRLLVLFDVGAPRKEKEMSLKARKAIDNVCRVRSSYPQLLFPAIPHACRQEPNRKTSVEKAKMKLVSRKLSLFEFQNLDSSRRNTIGDHCGCDRYESPHSWNVPCGCCVLTFELPSQPQSSRVCGGRRQGWQ